MKYKNEYIYEIILIILNEFKIDKIDKDFFNIEENYIFIIQNYYNINLNYPSIKKYQLLPLANINSHIHLDRTFLKTFENIILTETPLKKKIKRNQF
jgi:hypothetical protein